MSYPEKYNEIVNKYNNYADNINSRYDEIKSSIENKEITEEYTLEDNKESYQRMKPIEGMNSMKTKLLNKTS